MRQFNLQSSAVFLYDRRAILRRKNLRSLRRRGRINERSEIRKSRNRVKWVCCCPADRGKNYAKLGKRRYREQLQVQLSGGPRKVHAITATKNQPIRPRYFVCIANTRSKQILSIPVDCRRVRRPGNAWRKISFEVWRHHNAFESASRRRIGIKKIRIDIRGPPKSI